MANALHGDHPFEPKVLFQFHEYCVVLALAPQDQEKVANLSPAATLQISKVIQFPLPTHPNRGTGICEAHHPYPAYLQPLSSKSDAHLPSFCRCPDKSISIQYGKTLYEVELSRSRHFPLRRSARWVASSFETRFISLIVLSKNGMSIPNSSIVHGVNELFSATYARTSSAGSKSFFLYFSFLASLLLPTNELLNIGMRLLISLMR